MSLRSQLFGDVSDFLRDEDMECPKTAEALINLLVALRDYREEGVALFPTVIVCDDLDAVRKLLPGGEAIAIAEGVRGPETALQALKRCAPLATGGWMMYLHRDGPSFRYGVLRAHDPPFAMPAAEALLAQTELKVLVAAQVAANSVEIRGYRKSRLQVYLSARRTLTAPPPSDIGVIVDAATGDVEESIRPRVAIVLTRYLSDALLASHGALVAVLKKDAPVPAAMKDGVILSPMVDFAQRVRDFVNQGDIEGLLRLESADALLRGVISCDGITLLSTDAKLLGYNIFVPPPTTTSGEQARGGSRRRAFGVLENLVNGGELVAAFSRSHDGDTQCKRAAT